MELTEKEIENLQSKLHEISAMPKDRQNIAMQKELSPEEMQFLQKQQCVFCKIVKGEIPTALVYQDDNFMAFLDANPLSPGHLLVIPKKHYAILPQLPDSLDAAYLKLIKVLASAVFEAVGAQGVNVGQNNGVVAGQMVPHLHFHIIPRFENDKVDLGHPKPIKLAEKQIQEIQKRIVAAAKGKVTKELEQAEEPKEKKGKKTKEKLEKIKSRLP